MKSCGTLLFCAVSVAASDPELLTRGNNQFAFDLYARLRDSHGNLAFSPFSISTALAMTYAGARGKTDSQMAHALHFDLPQSRLHPAFRQLTRDAGVGRHGGYDFAMANALWGQRGFALHRQFREICEQEYGAVLEQVDFINAAEAGRSRMNSWTEERTGGRIVELVKAGMIGPLSRLVLTNAVYFKGRWAAQFNKALTRDGPFTALDGSKVTVPLMQQAEAFGFAENAEAQVVEMRYAGGEAAMMLFLPKDAGGLARLESSLSEAVLARWVKELRVQRVAVLLPRFTVTFEAALGDTLKAMGMTDAFNPGAADFSGIAPGKGLALSAVTHKALIEVGEEGTEAAAATAVAIGITSDDPMPVFKVDRPFVFLIRHLRSGAVMFAGRVSNPKG